MEISLVTRTSRRNPVKILRPESRSLRIDAGTDERIYLIVSDIDHSKTENRMISTQNGKGFQGASGLLTWQLAYRPDDNVVLLETTGPIEKTWLSAMVASTVAFAEQHQSWRILADHRKSLLKLDPLEIYYCPRLLFSSGISSQHAISLVFSRRTEDLQFLENVCRNSGLHLSVFTEPGLALNRLIEAVDPLASSRAETPA